MIRLFNRFYGEPAPACAKDDAVEPTSKPSPVACEGAKLSTLDALQAWLKSLDQTRNEEQSRIRLLIFMHGEEISEKAAVMGSSSLYVFHHCILNEGEGEISNEQVAARIAILFVFEAITDAVKMRIFMWLTGGLSTRKMSVDCFGWLLGTLSGLIVSAVLIHAVLLRD